MADRKAAAKDTKSKVLTNEERAAMLELVQERKRTRKADEPDEESVVLAKIAEMPAADRALAERLHALIKATAPSLSPRTWYGMPAYTKNGQIVCFFQGAHKFKSRYATLGFNQAARLDDGDFWPVAFALRKLSRTEEAKIRELVKKAAS